MYDLNCPCCGTTYQGSVAGFCDCCGYEFTEAYISELIVTEKKNKFKRKLLRKKDNGKFCLKKKS